MSGNDQNRGNTLLVWVARVGWNGGKFRVEYAYAYSSEIDQPNQMIVATKSRKVLPRF